MKNIKKKISATLVGLAFLGLTVMPTFAQSHIIEKTGNDCIEVIEPMKFIDGSDPNIAEVAKTINETYKRCLKDRVREWAPQYSLEDGRTIRFDYYLRPVYNQDCESEWYVDGLYLNVSGVGIIDKDLDNMGGDDIIRYDGKVKHFRDLSPKTQEEIKEAYTSIIKEAPQKLLEAYEQHKTRYLERKAREAEQFEENILRELNF